MAKVLMVLTSHDRLGNTGRPTGFWLEEFAAPYYVLKDAGVEITLASPKGGQPPVDPKSDDPKAETPAMKRFKQDPEAQRRWRARSRSRPPPAGDYDAVFYPGGHGPLWDLAEDRDSIALIERLFDAGKPVAAVCHGPAALRHAKAADGTPLVKGKAVTGFANTRGSGGRAHERGAVPGGGRAQGRRGQVHQGGGLGGLFRGRREPDHRAEPRVVGIDGEGVAQGAGGWDRCGRGVAATVAKRSVTAASPADHGGTATVPLRRSAPASRYQYRVVTAAESVTFGGGFVSGWTGPWRSQLSAALIRRERTRNHSGQPLVQWGHGSTRERHTRERIGVWSSSFWPPPRSPFWS